MKKCYVCTRDRLKIDKVKLDTHIAIQEEQSKLYKELFNRTGDISKLYFMEHSEEIVKGVNSGSISVSGNYSIQTEGDIEIRLYVKAPSENKKMKEEYNRFVDKKDIMVKQKRKEEKQKIKELRKDIK